MRSPWLALVLAVSAVGLFASASPTFASAGFFKEFVIINRGSGNEYFGNPLSSGFNGQNLTSAQTWYEGDAAPVLNGAEANTFENSGDWVSNVRFLYIINSSAGAGSFSTITLAQRSQSGGDRKWDQTAQNIGLATRSPGTYGIEVYFQAQGNWSGGNWQFYNSATPNYRATFTVTALNPVSSPSAATDAASGHSTINLAWTRGTSGSLKNTIILRKTSAITTAPVDGTAYSVGNTIDGATVVYSGNGASFADTGLSANTRYYYAFYSLNGNYCSSGVTADTTTAPAVPTGLAASSVSSTGFTASWDSSTGATSYRLDVDDNSDFSSPLGGYTNLTVNGTNQAVTGLTANTTYYIRVRAVNATGTSSSSSSVSQLTAPATPSTPSASSVSSTGFTVSWSAVTGAASYRLDVDNNSDFSSPETGYNNLTVNTTSQAVSGLSAGTTYYVRVRAVNAGGTSASSSTLTQATSAAAATITTSGSLTAMSTTYGTASTEQSFTVSGSNLTGNLTVTAPTGFEVSQSSGSGYGSTTTITASGTLASTTIYARLAATTVPGSSYSGNFAVSGGGGTTQNVSIAASTVNTKALTISSAAVTSKIYDRTTTATITGSLSGVNGSDTVTLSGTGTFNTAAVGTGKAVTSTSSLGGAQASYYTLTQPTGLTGTITAAPLTVSGASATNRVYNRTTTVSVSGGSLSGVISGDTVTLGGTPTGSVATAAVGTGKAVTVSGYSISGTDSTNYSLTQPSLTVNITAASLTVTGATATDRAYNALTTVTVSGGSLSGVISGDTVTLGGSPAGTVATATVGSGKAVTVTGYSISGTDSGNYSLTQPSLTVNITKATPTISTAPTASSIKYAQALSASSLSGGSGSVSGSFAWTDGTIIPAPGTASYSVTFTPTDTTNYNTTNANVSVTSQIAQSRNTAGAASPTQPSAIYLGDTNRTFGADTWGTIDGAYGRGRLFVRHSNSNVLGGNASPWTDFVNTDTKTITNSPQFTNTGTWFWGIQMDYGATYGTNFWYKASASAWSDMSTNDVGSTLSVTVQAIPTPSGVNFSGVSTTQMTLNWTKATNSVATGGYDVLVLRHTNSGFTEEPTNGTAYSTGGSIGGATIVYKGSATSVANTGLTAGTTYYYKLYSENWSYYSAGATATVTTVPSAPAAPTGSAVTASNFTATWVNPGGATNYFLDVSTASNFATFVSGYSNKAVATTSDSITGLSANTTYYVRVRAQSSGGTSANSPSLTQLTAPAAPSEPTASSVLATSFTANWTAVTGATGYRLDVATDSGFTSFVTDYENKSVATTSDAVTGLTADTTYYVRVRAVNSGGTSANSATLTAATAATATAPTITGITPGNGELSVAFTAGEAGGLTITNYEYSTDNGSTYTAVSPASTASPIVITGLTNGTSYTVRIRAVNSDESKGSASGASSATPRTTPGAPTGLTVTAGSTTLTASFTAPASDGGSAITNYEYSTNGGTSFTAVSPASTSTSISITGLSNGTAYNVQVRAVNAAGSGTATASVSATPRTTPTVTTGASSSVAAYSAALAGNITATGGNNPSVRGVEYSTNNNFTTGTGTQSSSSGDFSTGVFTNNATGLASATTYYWRAFASNAAGITYGAQSNFTTLTVPGGKNPATANATTAFLGDTIRLDLDAWQNLGTNARSFATVFGRYDNADLSVAGNTVQGAGRNPGNSADGVWANTPQLTNSGTFYWAMRISYQTGNDYWFDASRPSWSDLALERPSAATLSIVVSPLNNPTIVSATAAGSTSVDLTWTRGTSGNAKDTVIVRREGSAVATDPTQGTAYSANDILGSGTVIYRGSGTNFTDTGLTAGTTYHYKLYAENWSHYSTGVTTNTATAGTPTITISGLTNNATTTAFTTTYGTPSASQSFTVGGSNLTTNLVATAPTGFQVSTNDSLFTNAVSFAQSSGTASGTLYLRLSGSANAGNYNSASVNLTSTDATTRTITTPSSGNTIAKATPTIGAMPSVSSSIIKGDTLSNDLLSGGSATGVGGGSLSGSFGFGDTSTRQTATGDKSVTFTPTDTTNYANITNNVSVTVAAVPDPTSVSATSGGTNSIALTHNLTSSKNVMIVRRTGSAVDWVPTEGTTYANNFTTNGHTVVHGSLAANSSTNSGLSASTTYHYKIFSENWGYYSPGVTASATTDALPPSVSVSGTPAAMTTTYGTASSASQFTVSGSNLTASMSVAAPAGFEVSTSSGSGFASSVTLSPTSSTVDSTTIYVRLKSNASPGANSGNVTVASTGATSQTVAVSGTVNVASMTMNVSSPAGSMSADYTTSKLYADEVAGTTNNVTITFNPGVTADEVEVWTNLNNRDRANNDANSDGIPDGIIPPDPLTDKPVGYTSGVYPTDGYFQAHPMGGSGGTYTLTLNANKTGAYRLTARYRMNGGPWVYYNYGGKRDHAITVTPVLARNMNVYEINTLNVNATGSTFETRSTFESLTNSANGRVNLDYLRNMGVNTLWFQPIHPNGSEGREAPGGVPYDPGSPYAVKNFFEVMEQMSQGNNRGASMTAFTNFVSAADTKGVHVMLDAPFNHTAYDAEIDEEGLAIMSNAVSTSGWSATDEIKDREARFYSKNNSGSQYAGPATSAGNVAPAPDRNDFGKWNDVIDVYFGRYSSLVTGNPASGAALNKYKNEEDQMTYDDLRGGLNTDGAVTRAVWQYFARYVPYWLEKTGLPAGSSAVEQTTKGVDGLRADFGQGMPPQFWEYVINVAREHKWSFVFMSESLDGGEVTYRSNRHFDILNENIVFPWQNASATTAHRTIFEDRRAAYGQGLVLLNNTSHDEAGYADPWQAFIRYAVGSTVDGAPMIMYGQEIGTGASLSFDHYEVNFGKSIPHFKRYNSMNPQWTAWGNNSLGAKNLMPNYSGVGLAREFSPALRSSNRWFLNPINTVTADPDIFAVAKYETANASPASSDVVLAFVNLNRNSAEANTFGIPAGLGTVLGIEADKYYNVKNIAAYLGPNNEHPNRRNQWLWETPRLGSDILANGIYVSLNAVPSTDAAWTNAPYEAQYLKVYAAPALTTGGSPNALTTVYGSASTNTTFALSAANVHDGVTMTAPAGFQISTNASTGFTNFISITNNGTIGATTVYARLAATNPVGSYSGNVTIASSGGNSTTVALPTSSVTAKTLTITGATATSRAFNGTTNVAVSGGSLVGLVGSDAVTLAGTPSGTISNPNVGADKPVAVTGYDLSGGLQVNYTLTQPTGVTVTITPATPTIAASPTATAITEGQALSASTLSGGSVTGVGGATVNGNFTFTAPATVPAVGTANQSVTFTPSDANYGTTTGVASVTVNPAAVPLPEGTKFIVSTNGVYSVVNSNNQPIEGATFNYLYRGRTNGVSGFNTSYAFMTYSNSNAPTQPGFYRVTATAGGNYTGTVTEDYGIAGPLIRTINLTRTAGTATNNFSRATVMSNVQRVTISNTLATGSSGLSWTNAVPGVSTMSGGATNPNAVTLVSSNTLRLVPASSNSINDTFGLTISDGATPLAFPVIVTTTNAQAAATLTAHRVTTTTTTITNIVDGVPVVTNVSARRIIFMARPGRTINVTFMDPTTGQFRPITTTNVGFITATNQPTTNQMSSVTGGITNFHQPVNFAPPTGVIELMVDPSMQFYMGRLTNAPTQ